ncbi:Coiled-coil domain-containing protein [Wickerhamomyces ciferrii]|uniref:Coiled-coil domain-containing protein n=1 Tax=Wickerhamomyces ciferrii (strain ATCC 14091 / BCRC 22168 / CBS 111 / JCM 3599 / NBRC 0793 / NRRL Y-1031 F-60-10) TaxID=1206466 RepID=K0KKW4_WICCF|nr:Coiled-coil domain-containing protein [Wickerhamomyces ciferrii]CCH41753.1 Coiled-coil domain-containing protein [Wickerhamomyces ciferrii]
MLNRIITHGSQGIIRHGIRTCLCGSSIRIRQFHHTHTILEPINGEVKKKPKITIERNQNDKTQASEDNSDNKKDSNKDDKSGDDGSVLDLPIHDELKRKIDDSLIKNYVDTMKVFNQLNSLGFNSKQSDIILQLLNENLTYQLDKMNGKFTSSMEMENELYLFEAAQSELRIEINTSRELDLHNLDRMKNSLDDLVREEGEDLNKFMIVSQNDTEVSVHQQRNENTLLQKGIKMKIKDLDNKISTNINSDIKSDIENLRWQTTRSGLAAILVLVFSIIGGVSISKKINRDEQPTEVILHTIKPEERIDDEEEDEQVLK